MRSVLSLAAAVAMIGTASAALKPVTVKGNAFFVGDDRVCPSLPAYGFLWLCLLTGLLR